MKKLKREGKLQKIVREITEILQKPMIAISARLINKRMEEEIALQNLAKQLEERINAMKQKFPKRNDFNKYRSDSGKWKRFKLEKVPYIKAIEQWFVENFGDSE